MDAKFSASDCVVTTGTPFTNMFSAVILLKLPTNELTVIILLKLLMKFSEPRPDTVDTKENELV